VPPPPVLHFFLGTHQRGGGVCSPLFVETFLGVKTNPRQLFFSLGIFFFLLCFGFSFPLSTLVVLGGTTQTQKNRGRFFFFFSPDPRVGFPNLFWVCFFFLLVAPPQQKQKGKKVVAAPPPPHFFFFPFLGFALIHPPPLVFFHILF